MSDAEIESVKAIDTYTSRRPSDLTGIEYFTALEELNCRNNMLTTLDLSRNTALLSLDCSYNRLSTLDLSSNTKLVTLHCENMHNYSNGKYYKTLYTLDVSKCTALQTLECWGNNISVLDVSKFTALKTLNCWGNNISVLDVSKNTALVTLNCAVNKLSALDVSKNTKLTDLSFGDNITSINLTANTALESLGIGEKLTSINLAANTALVYIDAKGCSLTSLNLAKCTALQYLEADDSKITSLNLSANTALKGLTLDNTNITSLNLSGFTALEYIFINGCKLLASLNLSGCVSLKDGITDCMGTVITSADLSGCTTLTEIVFSENSKINSLNLSGCTALEMFQADDSTITSLNLSGCTALKKVDAENIGLAFLDISGCTALNTLMIQNNALAYVSVPRTASLTDYDFSTQNLVNKYIAPVAPCTFDFKTLMPAEKISSIIASAVQGYSSNGSLISTTYDPATGIAMFEYVPTEIDYNFSMGSGLSYLPVNVTTTTSASGGSSSNLAAPEILTSGLTSAVTGLTYTTDLYATGTKPITWSITDGALPPGMGITSSGTISGIPTATGSYSFTVQAANVLGSASQAMTLVVAGSSAVTAPAITTAALTAGNVGADYGFTFTASGVRPISWAVLNGEIPGLTLSDSGQLTGTPTTAGTFTIKVQAQNFMGVDSGDFTITVETPPANLRPTITTTELAFGTVDTEYSFQLTASGTPPFTWEIIKGKLPKNLSLSSSGMITGMLNQASKKTFTVKASNAYGSDTRIVTLYPYKYPQITTTALKDAIAGKSYNVTIGKKGSKPFSWTLEGGLPSGLTFNSERRRISGKPDQIGTYNLRFVLSNPVGDVVRNFTLKVNAELPKITPNSLKDGTIGKAYKAEIKAKGTNPITFTMDGTLPDGLTFDANTGLLSGTPGEECKNSQITITASNVGGDTEKVYHLTIKGSAPKISSKTLPDGAVGSEYSATVEAAGSKPMTWSAAGLPQGLTMEDGTISGTPKEYGTFKVKVTASNSAKSVSKSLKMTITSPPYFAESSTALPDAAQGKNYSYTFGVEGTKKIALSVSDGTLPGGLSLSGLKLKGKPSEAGTFRFTLTAQNGFGSATQEFTLNVNANVSKNSALPNNGIFDGVVLSDDYDVVANLGTVSVDVAGMYDFTVSLSYDAEVGGELVYLAGSSEPSDDDDIAEFFDESGREIDAVPENRRVSISVWLNAGRVYKPAIAVRR